MTLIPDLAVVDNPLDDRPMLGETPVGGGRGIARLAIAFGRLAKDVWPPGTTGLGATHAARIESGGVGCRGRKISASNTGGKHANRIANRDRLEKRACDSSFLS